ncbi:ABC transporter permease subunit [Cellulomonas endophytica]|uniref:ABC transporter permease subunit n=1 Tax=Cellulomonas endophytica TaxID=2494735 RepID=UPI00101387E4|nr:ABC transporter permease subunit [Cellulomonas endophytica]
MSRLLRVELRRLRHRRLVLVAHLAVLVVAGLALFAAWDGLQPLSPAESADAERFYAEAVQEWEENGAEQVAECEEQEAEERERTGDDTLDFACEAQEPQREWFFPVVPPLGQLLPELLGAAALVLTLAGLGIGGTSTAAELSTRSMSTWLTFEPRRLRVYASKVGAAALGVVPMAVVTLALLAGGTAALYAVEGASTALTGPGSGGLVLRALRVVVLTVAAATAGAALGILLRHTAAVLGAVLGWLVVVEAILVTQVPVLSLVSVRVNALGWVEGGTSYYTQTCSPGPQGTVCDGVEHVIEIGHSAAVLGVGLVVLVALAAAVFRRRDEG